MRYVIIGNSIAGISAAKAIRASDGAGDITIISGEKGGSYYRPLIPALIAGQKSEQDIEYSDPILQGMNIITLLGTVIKVDSKKKEVLLASGGRLSFDSLLLATGGSALKPRIPGLEGDGVYPLRTLAQAIRLGDSAAFAQHAVVIGGGLVGIKAALALREKERPNGTRCQVTVVEVLPEILNSRLDQRGAALVRAALMKKGVAALTGTTVAGIARRNSVVTGVKLASGKTLKADLVVIAAGVKPNTAFLKGSGVRTRRGVLVDDMLRTNAAGIYAAGDVVEGKDLLTNGRAMSGLWTNAAEMGRVAGMNMAGGKVKYPGFLPVMNASEIAGIPFISVGIIEPQGKKFETVTNEDENGYWKLVRDREHLVGAVFVGDLQRAGIYANLIKNRIPISRVKERVMKRAAGYVDFLNG